MRPRVFVSSVIEGFADIREAARSAIESVGAHAVMVNEDFPSAPISPRNACLDAVDSSDVYIGVIGPRGGWTTPSGKLVVQEEYERAKARKIPILLFIQTGHHDEQASRFIDNASDYVAGQFRKEFSDSNELRRQISASLAPIVSTLRRDVVSPNQFMNWLTARVADSSGVHVRVSVAPERDDELIDPVRLGSGDFQRLVYEIAHAGVTPVLSYEQPKSASVDQDAIVVRQGASYGGDRETAELRLTDRGALLIELPVRPASRGFAAADINAAMTVAHDEIRSALSAALQFAAAWLDRLDPFERFDRLYIDASVVNLGYRALVPERKPQASVQLHPMRDQTPIVAYDEARLITRGDLRSPSPEIERLMAVLIRRAG